MTIEEHMLSLPGWDRKTPTKRRGHCGHPQCTGRSEVTVVAQATARENSKTRSLQAKSVALCNEHALELFSELAALIEARRS